MTIALGIDLGTTYTVAAVVEDGRPRVICNREGQRLTPSVVAFREGGKPLVGQPAKEWAAAHPGEVVYSIKRHMGSNYRPRLGGRAYAPQEISGLVLAKVKADAEARLGQPVQQAVITVPAYFNDRQRQATLEAGRLAGLEVLRIINEPTAAALAYGLDRQGVHTVLVWDLGGGTFDVSILELGEGLFEVRAVAGDTWLGGDDYDQRLVDYLALEFRKLYGVEITSQDTMAWHRLREASEKAKIELSTATEARVRLRHGGGQRLLEVRVRREGFQALTQDLVERMAPPTLQALADAGLRAEELDRVVLVGGATRMPAVRRKARELLGHAPDLSLNPDQVVALGAALQAGVLTGRVQKVVLLDVIPLSLGIETQGGLFARIIPRNTPLPASEGRVFTTAADGQTSVNIHVLQGEREMALYNVSLGRFSLEGIPPLPRGTPKVEVSFQVDMDGIVHVSAKDLHSEREGRIRLVSSRDLRPQEVERLVSEASSQAAADRRQREQVEAGLMLDNLLLAADRFWAPIPGSGLEAEAAKLGATIARAREARDRGDVGEMKELSQELRALLASCGRVVA